MKSVLGIIVPITTVIPQWEQPELDIHRSEAEFHGKDTIYLFIQHLFQYLFIYLLSPSLYFKQHYINQDKYLKYKYYMFEWDKNDQI